MRLETRFAGGGGAAAAAVVGFCLVVLWSLGGSGRAAIDWAGGGTEKGPSGLEAGSEGGGCPRGRRGGGGRSEVKGEPLPTPAWVCVCLVGV